MSTNNNPSPTDILTIETAKDFKLVESYKALRTNLLFAFPSLEGHTCRKVLITSVAPGEGKTTTAVNLAISLAQNGTRVLLIDGDMRKPSVHRYFNIKSRNGLSNILSGMNKCEDCVYQVPNMPNFSVLPSGIIPPNPSELLGSKAMNCLLSEFEECYDYIILDSPPLALVTDALALTPQVDGVAFVVSYGKSTIPDVNKAVEAVRFAKGNLLGVILNRIPNNKKKAYRMKDYYSEYSYNTYNEKDPE